MITALARVGWTRFVHVDMQRERHEVIVGERTDAATRVRILPQ
jgi:hypothetical protein